MQWISALPSVKGTWAERRVERFLKQYGLHRVARNVRYRIGEIDLIMADSALPSHTTMLIFVEVKYRKNNAFGHPFEQVHWAQQQRIIKAAQYFLIQNAVYSGCSFRFDVCGVSHDIEWIPSAFDGNHPRLRGL